MREVRPNTAVAIRAEVEPHEVVDELAHAHGSVVLDPHYGDPTSSEIIPDEIDDGAIDGLYRPEIDDGGGEGGSSADSQGDGEAEQFVFVDGKPVLTTRSGRPTSETAFDQSVLAADYLNGGLDLVADGEMVRMVFNGRLRLSNLAIRTDRRNAAALLAPLKTVDELPVDLGPYGPLNMRFDLGSRTIPNLERIDRLKGMSYAGAGRAMLKALEEGRDDDFAAMSRELGEVQRFLRGVAEVDPDLAFQEFKLLFADLATPAFKKYAPTLVDTQGTVDAKRWLRGWHRLEAAGDAKARDAVGAFSPAQLRFLLAAETGEVFGSDDAKRIAGPDYDTANDAAIYLIRMRVMSAEMRSAATKRSVHMGELLEHDVPKRAAFAGDASFGAAVLAMARQERAGATARFSDQIVNGSHQDEDRTGPFIETHFGSAVRLEHIEAFAKGTSSDSNIGLADRLGSNDPTVAARADALTVAVHESLRAQGIERGLLGAPPPGAAAQLLFGRPIAVTVLDPSQIDAADLSATLKNLGSAGGAMIATMGERREPIATWGTPRLHGVVVHAEDLACCTREGGVREGLTRGLTNLANTLEREGIATDIVDEITALKSHVNRPGQLDAKKIVDDVLQFLRPHLTIDPEDGSGVPVVLTITPDGSPRFIVATSSGDLDSLALLRPES